MLSLCLASDTGEGNFRKASTRARGEARRAVAGGQRSECSLIWHLENSNGEVLDFRGTASPQAVLGVRLTSQPRAEPQHGSSEGYSWDLRR